MSQRVISKVEIGIDAIDGQNVHLKRLIGNDRIRIDEISPILLLDEIRSNKISEYQGGFPFHPHRGFQTITYMLEGSMEHHDNTGNDAGIITPGSVQVMTAGRGIIHSEMPIIDENNKNLHCFQIWLNLKSKHKMISPNYQNISSEQIPKIVVEDEFEIKIISGKYRDIEGPLKGIESNPLLLDIKLKPNTKLTDITIPSSYNAIVYVFEGSVDKNYFGPCKFMKQVNKSQIGIFFNNGGDSQSNDNLEVISGNGDLRFLLLAADPIYNEKVAHFGTIVMNNDDEINQAILDFQLNNF